MNDPHVEKLFYRLELLTGSFYNPPPVTDETDSFRVRLENEIATFEFKQHFASVPYARMEVETYLKAWEIRDALACSYPTIKFSYRDAEVIDRNPPPPGSSLVIQPEPAIAKATVGQPTVIVSRGNYPDPPKNFVFPPDVKTLWNRYMQYKEGQEQLLNMAYHCLTFVERESTRKQAAETYKISRNVLKKLGILSSRRGDALTARKAGDGTPLSQKEIEWVEDAVRRIILRVGELNAGGSLREITMADLPPL